MIRTWPLVFTMLIACGSRGGGGGGELDTGTSIKKLSIDLETSREEPPGHYLAVRFHRATPGDLDVRTACLVGATRFVDLGPSDGAPPEGMPEAMPFITTTLSEKPSLCELAFVAPRPSTAPPVVVVCWRPGARPTVGACPPNAVAGPGTAAGLSITSFAAHAMPARPDVDDLALLALELVVEAHRDLPATSQLRITTRCKDGATEEIDREEIGGLRAGESFHAFQGMLDGDQVPGPGESCTVTVAAVDAGGAPTTVATYCYRDDAVTPGACPA